MLSVLHIQYQACLLHSGEELVLHNSDVIVGAIASQITSIGEFPAQMASDAENVSIWWRHHGWPGATQRRVINCSSAILPNPHLLRIQVWFDVEGYHGLMIVHAYAGRPLNELYSILNCGHATYLPEHCVYGSDYGVITGFVINKWRNLITRHSPFPDRVMFSPI